MYRNFHAAGPGSIPGRDKFPLRGFSGFFLTCKTNVRKIWALKVPEYQLAVISSFQIHLVRMNGCVNRVYHFSCSCCLGGGPGIELISHRESHPMSLRM